MPDLPGIGKVSKGWVIGVGAISAGAIGYAWWKHRQNAAAASTATTSTTAPTDTGTTGDPYPPDGTTGDPTDPNSTDPETGMTYGDEQLYGGGSELGGGYGYGGYGGSSPPTTTGGGGTGEGPGSFTTNADWAQYAEQQLSGTVDATTLSAALGVYLTGRSASPDQESLIDQAIAVAGYPPVAGPGNYPPNIKQGGSGPGGGSVTVPNVTGKTVNQAQAALKAAGLSYNTNEAPDKNGYDRIVYGTTPKAGTSVTSGSHVSLGWHYVKQ